MNPQQDQEWPVRTGLSMGAALMAGMALVTVLVGGLVAWQVSRWGEEVIRLRVEETLRESAGHIARQVSVVLDERLTGLTDLRDLLEIEMADATPDRVRRVLERWQANQPDLSWIARVDRQGQVLAATGGLLEGQSVAHREWFQQARSGRSFLGDVHPAKMLEAHLPRTPDGPVRLLDLVLPLRGPDGEVVGVLGAHLNWRVVVQVVRRAAGSRLSGLPPSVSILSSDGTVLYDSREAAGRLLTSLPASGSMGVVVWPGEPTPSLVTAADLPSGTMEPGLKWRIVLREPASGVDAAVRAMQWRVVGVSIVAAGLFSLLGLFVARRLTRSLQQLVADIRRFGQTGLPPPVHPEERLLEVRELQTSFTTMARQVVAHKTLLQDTQVEIVSALGRAGEFRDNETGNHVVRMSLCSAHLAELAGMTAVEVDMLRLASQLHDIGKIGIPDHILLKPGRFTPAERAVMERHVAIGHRILSGIDTPLTLLAREIAQTHHEKWDGSGYPRALRGEDIPLTSRIVAICDVFDALLSSRPYKDCWTLERTIEFLREQSGKHFDPGLLALFLSHLDDFVLIRTAFLDEASPAPQGAGARGRVEECHVAEMAT